MSTKTTFNVAELLALSDQQVFDIVVPALLNQGRGAYNPIESQCAYLAPDGSKCAIGLLLDEATHDLIIDGRKQSMGFISLLSSDFFDVEVDVEPRERFINAIQNAHDYASMANSVHFNEEISLRFMVIADQFDLDPAALVNHPNYRVEV